MTMRNVGCLVLVACLLAGCDDAAQTTTARKSGDYNAPLPPPPPPPPPLEPGKPRDPRREPTTPAITGDQYDRIRAKVGVGKKGRSLEGEESMKMLVTPALAFFRTQERIVFEVQVPHALDLYKALNGRPPKSHEQFMSEIIKANHIKLPELPTGHRYVYDPKSGQLMVERPKK